jgi:hypothetical protein
MSSVEIPARAHWETLAKQLELPKRAFIEGRFVDAASGETFDDGRRAMAASSRRSQRAIPRTSTAPFARRGPLHAIEQYTQLKTTRIDLR